ncbi:hypothetical protein [Pseudarthrobacter sulfonivorans]|uniref:hypothetical protein n=1 Tax=Pseudarthrobacter sulfonivorans TaxID=121292 RepID=UPI0027888261|nr:hypothetical protein [Pseudarthrobacter sulfonivorans]MDQ0000519.1 hypothetical protein [Pseudarthrobacter sulfonivorans]
MPIQILIVGVLYPMLLNDDRVTRRGAQRFGAWVPLATTLAIAGGCIWLSFQGRSSVEILPIYILAAANALVQARLWYLAVAAEAEGKPGWMAAVALPANALATLVMLLPWPNSTATVTAMLAALVVANTGYLVLMMTRSAGQNVLRVLPTTPTRKHSAHWWFLSKSFVGYGGLMVVQSLALVLPPATLTLLTLPMKIVGSVAATFVNAVMPRLVHQDTESPSGARRFLRQMVLLLGGTGVIGALGIYSTVPAYFTQAVIVALWLVASASASVAQRLMFRFLPPSASRITLVVVPMIVAGVAVSATLDGFGLIALLSAYALVDAATSFLILIALRDKLMAIVSGLISAALTAIWIISLI